MTTLKRNKYRQQIADAVSLELVYQIMGRYHAPYDLRIIETHPGGGQYDCRSMYSHKEKQQFFDFNLPADSFVEIWKFVSAQPSRSSYLSENKSNVILANIMSNIN